VYVTLNGAGEPLLNPETPKFIRFCRSRRIMTSMPTNMLLMDKAMRQEIMENPPGHLSFSLHATDKELFGTITSSSGFERCVDNFEQLQLGLGRRKSRLWVFCVLQNANLDHYEEMFVWLKEHKMLKAFTLATVFLFGKDKERLLDVNKINQMLTRLRHDIQACQDKEKAAFLKSWEQEAVNLIQSSKMCVTGPCLIPWYSTYIKAGGEVTPCCYLDTEEFVMGNIRETPFAQIWNGRRYQEFRKHLKEDRKSLKTCASCWTNQESLIRELRPFFFIKKGLA
jgi:radical SAM protein with 4Fe4S-binding SPASM domain